MEYKLLYRHMVHKCIVPERRHPLCLSYLLWSKGWKTVTPCERRPRNIMETAIIYIYIVVLHPLCEAAPWSATMHTKFVALYENGLQDLV